MCSTLRGLSFVHDAEEEGGAGVAAALDALGAAVLDLAAARERGWLDDDDGDDAREPLPSVFEVAQWEHRRRAKRAKSVTTLWIEHQLQHAFEGFLRPACCPLFSPLYSPSGVPGMGELLVTAAGFDAGPVGELVGRMVEASGAAFVPEQLWCDDESRAPFVTHLVCAHGDDLDGDFGAAGGGSAAQTVGAALRAAEAARRQNEAAAERTAADGAPADSAPRTAVVRLSWLRACLENWGRADEREHAYSHRPPPPKPPPPRRAGGGAEAPPRPAADDAAIEAAAAAAVAASLAAKEKQRRKEAEARAKAAAASAAEAGRQRALWQATSAELGGEDATEEDVAAALDLSPVRLAKLVHFINGRDGIDDDETSDTRWTRKIVREHVEEALGVERSGLKPRKAEITAAIELFAETLEARKEAAREAAREAKARRAEAAVARKRKAEEKEARAKLGEVSPAARQQRGAAPLSYAASDSSDPEGAYRESTGKVQGKYAASDSSDPEGAYAGRHRYT